MKSPLVLMIENDPDDRYFTTSTIKDLHLDVEIEFATFQPHLLEEYDPKPALVLLATHTYPEQGLSIVSAFKSHREWSHVPVVVLSEQMRDDHVKEYYRGGANSVIAKPHTEQATRSKIEAFFRYWFEVAELTR